MEKHGDDNKVQLLKRKGRVKNSHWALKATIITFFTSAFFSFVAESTESNGNLIVIVVLLLFLIVGNVVFDGIGIAAATADETEVKRLSKHCGRSEKIAIYIVENADIVSNVCNDVIGDIFGILSGACTVVITASVTKGLDTVTGKDNFGDNRRRKSRSQKPIDYEIYGTRHYVFKGTFGTFARKTKEKKKRKSAQKIRIRQCALIYLFYKNST